MAQRRFHYEQAFEHYLRANRIPYVAVDEARKALLPAGDPVRSIKSFDFVVYGPGGRNLLLDVKGRKYSGRSGRRMENWVTQEDVEGLQRWSGLFGSDFEATFLFMYWCEKQPPDALFEEIFEFGGRWYALREITLAQYMAAMQTRSQRWGTLSVPTAQFHRISRSFSLRASSAEEGEADSCAAAGNLFGGDAEGTRAAHRAQPPARRACDGSRAAVC